MTKEKVGLAYSDRFDTSVAISWLKKSMMWLLFTWM